MANIIKCFVVCEESLKKTDIHRLIDFQVCFCTIFFRALALKFYYP